MSEITAKDYLDQNWSIDKTNTQFLRYGDVVEFAKAGKLFRVRVIRGDYTVAVGEASLVKGAMETSFVGRVGAKNVPFVDVRFELSRDAVDPKVLRRKFKLTPTYDGGVMPDQGGSAAGSGSSSGGGN